MKHLKGISTSLFWLLLTLPALFPAQLRPHNHTEIHATEAGAAHHDACSICDVPVLLDLPCSFQLPEIPLVFSAQTAHLFIPFWAAPEVGFESSRAPPFAS
jgi:hypothetical protein